MKEITSQRLKELFSYDHTTGKFTRLKTQGGQTSKSVVGWLHQKGYRYIRVDSVIYFAHRLVWLYVYGKWPEDQLDHRNRLKDDNRVSNLREADTALNQQNIEKAQTNNKLGILGVTRSQGSKTYRAGIGSKGKTVYLGSFPDPYSAHGAYLKAKRVLHAGCTL